MPSVAKSIKISSVNPRNMLITVLVLLLIVALFFIPEIVAFQRAILGKSDKKVRASNATTTSGSNEENQIETSTSALDGILESFRNTFEQGDKKAKTDDKGRAMLKTGKNDTRNAAEIADKAIEDGKVLNWKMMKSKPVRQLLNKAEAGASSLAKDIDVRYVDSRYALLSFISGLRYVKSDAARVMRVEDALAYLQRLDRHVTDAFIREGVPTADFNQWSDSSLAAFFESGNLKNANKLRRPFNPNLQLVRVRVTQEGTRSGKLNETAKAYLYLKGAVVGRDTAFIEVFLNGEYIKKMKPRAAGHNGLRTFMIGHIDARGVYTFRVQDKYGSVWEKHYAFYRNARRFPWSRKHLSRFMIPEGSGKDIDMRLERLFAVSSGRIIKGTSAIDSVNFVANDQPGFSKF